VKMPSDVSNHLIDAEDRQTVVDVHRAGISLETSMKPRASM
jgi:hypothetical protein